PEASLNACIGQICDETRALVQALRRRSAAPVLMHNFAPPRRRQLGILDAQLARGQAQWVHRMNEALAAVCRDAQGIYVVDYAGLVARFGATRWYDERMRLYARAPIAADQWGTPAASNVGSVATLHALPKRCVAVVLGTRPGGGA